MSELLKVEELELQNQVLVPISIFYFCSDECQLEFLKPYMNLWSQVSPAIDEEIGKICNKCGKQIKNPQQ